jgi:hypothetical protein
MTPFYRRSALALCLAVAIPAVAIPAAGAPMTPKAAAAAKALTGTWALVRYENTAPDGKVTTPFGTHPKGYFTYDPTGHLSIHIMRTPPVAPFAAGDTRGTDAEIRAAYDGYAGYFGTWRINPDATAVIHVVEGALRPSYTGTEQFRPFTLNGDTLIVRPAPGEYRELRRVR